MIYLSVVENLIVLLFPEFSNDCYPYSKPYVIDDFTFLDQTELGEVLFRVIMSSRSHPHPFIAFRPHQPSYPISTKNMRCCFLFLPTHATSAILHQYPSLHQICFSYYFIFQHPPSNQVG